MAHTTATSAAVPVASATLAPALAPTAVSSALTLAAVPALASSATFTSTAAISARPALTITVAGITATALPAWAVLATVIAGRALLASSLVHICHWGPPFLISTIIGKPSTRTHPAPATCRSATQPELTAPATRTNPPAFCRFCALFDKKRPAYRRRTYLGKTRQRRRFVQFVGADPLLGVVLSAMRSRARSVVRGCAPMMGPALVVRNAESGPAPGVLWPRCWSSSGGRVHRYTRVYSTSGTRLPPHRRGQRGCVCCPRDLYVAPVDGSRPAGRFSHRGFVGVRQWWVPPWLSAMRSVAGTRNSWVGTHCWGGWCCPQCGVCTIQDIRRCLPIMGLGVVDCPQCVTPQAPGRGRGGAVGEWLCTNQRLCRVCPGGVSGGGGVVLIRTISGCPPIMGLGVVVRTAGTRKHEKRHPPHNDRVVWRVPVCEVVGSAVTYSPTPSREQYHRRGRA